MHTHCLSCGRALRSAASQARGRGRHCAAKLRAAAKAADLRDYKAHQLEAARELIEDAAIIPIRGRRIYRAVSSDGTELYTTARQACTCPAGRAGRDCYHRAAVAILTAA
ncbi:hypothetical protein E6W39_24360 [Kitasatospora acidiphila]|uniref:SWIM-type domain-containing protein n=1 Tax=Kitasatospora acidiphila TaxID=2567942 RepID=A0A540W6Z6_9ACTN|nr:DUF6011 domain-containing protein [Kitasatospora acidiphila]TQF04786.1 hypothetical protein E6W39_24360 [Kitasatospora acidiphila]